MRPICLDHLSLYDLSALDLIHVAAETGFNAVSLFIQPLPLGPYLDLISDAAARRAVVDALKTCGLQVGVVEPFILDESADWETFERSADFVAEVGGRVNALGFESDPALLMESMYRLSQLSAAAGVEMTIEAFPLSSIHNQALALELAGACGDHVGLCLDALHVRRAGENWSHVAELPAHRIFHVQLSDGPLKAPADRFEEAATARQLPGQGEFELPSLLKVIPSEALIAAEAPFKLAAHLPARSRAQKLLAAARSILTPPSPLN